MLKLIRLVAFAPVILLSGCGGGSDNEDAFSITLDQKSYEINTAVTRTVTVSGSVKGLPTDSTGYSPMIGYYMSISPQAANMIVVEQPVVSRVGRFSFTVAVHNNGAPYPVGNYTVTPYFNYNFRRSEASAPLTVK